RKLVLTLVFLGLTGCVAQTEGPALAARAALHPGGLLVQDRTDNRLLPFGTSRDDVVVALRSALGEPLNAGRIEDCGADYVNWAPGLATYFDAAGFSGWSTREGVQGLVLAARSELGVGSTRRNLDEAYDLVIALSTLGLEFEADGVSGLL